MKRALLIVDVQRDLCNGFLHLEDSPNIAREISSWLDAYFEEYELIATTQNWHTEGVTELMVAETEGAALHPDLRADDPLIMKFYKGQVKPQVSAFAATDSKSPDRGVELEGHLRHNHITHLDIVGMPTDWSVHQTAVDAASRDFDTTVIIDLTTALTQEDIKKSANTMRLCGIHVRTKEEHKHVFD